MANWMNVVRGDSLATAGGGRPLPLHVAAAAVLTLAASHAAGQGCGGSLFATEQRYRVGDVPDSVCFGDLDGDGDLDMAITNAGPSGDYADDSVSVLLNNGDGSFAPEQVFATGDQPGPVSVGDLDMDGDLDMVIGNTGFGTTDISVLLNNGDGTFGAQTRYETAQASNGVALGDLDGDGDLDIAVATSGGDDMSVLLNNGDGTFAPRRRFIAGNNPWDIALGDLDGDGDLDSVVVNFSSSDISVFMNNGNGTFASQQRYSTGTNPGGIALGDLDSDGDLDMAVANYWGNDTSVLLNNGDGTFASEQRHAVGINPDDVALGDMDMDGDLDMVVSNNAAFSDDFSVLLNDGAGSFSAEQRYPAGERPRGVCLGDVDGDGDLDVALANSKSDDTSVMLNGGDGAFATQQRYAVGAGPVSVSLGDLDGDGDVDMAVVNAGQPEAVSGDVSVLLNNGDGVFAPEQRYAWGSPPGWPRGGTLADLDGDGDLDMVVAAFSVFVLFNDGDGGLGALAGYATGGNAQDVALGDLDNDGDIDITVANFFDTRVLMNDGEGGFGPAISYPAGYWVLSVELGDLDGDGDLDMAAVNQGDIWDPAEDDISVLLNNGDGTFAPQQRLAVGNRPQDVALGDLDGDGDLDIAVVNFGDAPDYVGHASMLLNNGDGSFATQQQLGAWEGPRSITFGDVDGDGDLDMAVAEQGDITGFISGATSVLLNSGNGTFAPRQRYAAGERPSSAALGDIDGDGDQDLVATNAWSQDVSVFLNRCSPSCNAADLAAPLGVLDLADIVAFVTAFGDATPSADLAEPFGVFDLADVTAFVAAFNAGCP